MSTEKILSELYNKVRQLPIVAHIIDRLWLELPRELYYHSASHTEDVLHEVIMLSQAAQLPDRQKQLLYIAAAYHDAGFLKISMDNERFGAQYAAEAMSQFGGYENEEIELVKRMILDTRLQSSQEGLRQIPSNELSGYLLDADMSNLGRDDFVEKLELLRREFGFDRVLFLRRTLDLIQHHQWHTLVAREMRQAKTLENVATTLGLLTREEIAAGTGVALATERLSFLAKLPVLLNSSLSVKDVVERSLDHLKSRLFAQAATVFISDQKAQQLTFWALRGGEGSKLYGARMPAGRGIVGWVIEHNQSALVNDVQVDKRFFETIDKESQFKTKSMVCVPLSVRGEPPFGAIQALNRETGVDFTEEDLHFTEQFAAQISLALDNAMLLEKLKERTHALEVLEKRKNDVIALVTHEFRTPLNVIQNSADLLSNGLTESAEESIKIGSALARGVERLTKLVSQMRNVSLIGSENLVLNRGRLSISELLEKVKEEFLPVTGSRQIKLNVDITKDLFVNADDTLLRVALKNLMSNAIRFTPDQGTIIISLTSQSGMAVIAIRDTGIGIEADKIPLLGEKFYEVVDAMYHTSGDYQFCSSGLGLGLNAVKSILTAHGSGLEIESVLGKGSCFRFRLPTI
jgi:signal transduction histidine kinase/predicted metal-dependent HD superfamily phosphohydrolase